MASLYEDVRHLSSFSGPTSESLRNLEADWQPDLPPVTLAMAIIGKSLARGLDFISRDEVKSILDFAEELIKRPDEESGNAVATGFLEALLGEASAGHLDFRRIGPLLGDESRKYCQAWDQFTGVKTIGLV